MEGLLRSQSHIVVVDRRPQDYRDLASLAGAHGWHVHLLTNAQAAMRFSRLAQADLWMISVNLPDISGFDLVEMLHPKLASARVLLVADEYNHEHEALACGCGADLFWCKGPGFSVDCRALLDLLVVEARNGAAAVPAGQPGWMLQSDRNPVDR